MSNRRINRKYVPLVVFAALSGVVSLGGCPGPARQAGPDPALTDSPGTDTEPAVEAVAKPVIPTQSTFDEAELLQRSRASLNHAARTATQSPQFRAVLAAVRRGDSPRTSEAISQIEDDRALLFAVQFAQLEWLRAGHDLHELETLHEIIRARIKPKAFNLLSAMGHDWFYLWVDRVGIFLDADLLQVYGVNYPEVALHRAVETLCDQGQAPEALPLARAIGKWDKEDRAEALARVAVNLAPPARNEVFAEALAATGGPFIETGAEEVAACAKLVRVLATHGAPADDPLVKQTLTRLNTLLDDYIEYSCDGVFLAGVAAASRAREAADRHWLTHAEAMLRLILKEEIEHHLQIIIAQTEYALGLEEDASRRMQTLPSEFLGGELVAAHLRTELPKYPEKFATLLEGDSRAFPECLPLLVELTEGKNLDLAFQAIARDAPAQMTRQRVHGMMVALDFAGRDSYADQQLKEEYRQGANARALNLLNKLGGNQDRKRELLDAIQPSQVDIYTLPGMAADLDVDFLRQLEDVFQNGEPYNRTEGLLTLAAMHLEARRWVDAQRCVESAMAPPQEAPAAPWKPSIRARPAAPPQLVLQPGEPLTIPFTVALKRAEAIPDEYGERLDAYYALAQRVAHDPQSIQTVIALMEQAEPDEDDDGETSQAAIKLCKISHAWLLADEIDNALEVARRIPDCRFSGWGGWRIAELATEWFDKHPGRFRPKHADQIMQTLSNLHSQDLPRPLVTVVPPMFARLPAPDQASPERRILNAFEGRFRGRADRSICYASVGLANAILGDSRRAETAFDSATELLDEPSVYDVEGLVLQAIVEAARHCRLPKRAKYIGAALRNTQHDSRPLRVWERTMLSLFETGDQETIPDLIRQGDLRSDLVNDVRRSWWAEAPDHAPRPIEAMLAMFDDTPRNAAQAAEQIDGLARALEKEGHPEFAAKIRGLAGVRQAPHSDRRTVTAGQ